MKRALLIVGLTAAGLGILVWLGGGIQGKGGRAPDSEITDVVAVAEPSGAILAPDPRIPVGITEGRGFSVPAETTSVRFTDPSSGESVVVPDFLPWFFSAERVKPATARRAGEQAAIAEGVVVITYREPRTLAEARSLAHSGNATREEMVKWRIEAAWARADFLAGDLGMGSSDVRPDRADTRILLGGGVRIFDLEEDMEIQADSIEVFPYLDQAKSSGHVVVRHEAFELLGDGFDLQRRPHGTYLSIRENAVTHVYGDVEGPDGKPVFDFGKHDVRPGRIEADGGAILDHVRRAGAPRETLVLELTRRVHVEQEGGRTLDSERLRLFTFRELTQVAGKTVEGRWQLRKLDADGGVAIVYPGETKQGRRYEIEAFAQRLLHEVGSEGIASTLLEGAPEVKVRGSLPFGGVQGGEGAGTLTATAKEQMWLGPALATELPPDADPTIYRRAVLIGGAKIVHGTSGLEPVEDTIEGREMTLLLREADGPAPADERDLTPKDDAGLVSGSVIAVSFKVLGDVRLGGTRMTGMTHRLIGEALDTDRPVLIAEGPGTSFAFHELGRDERLLGGQERERSPATPGSDPTGAVEPPKPEWILHRLHAKEEVQIQTSLRGPSVGLPARLEGEELTYDRLGDRARMIGSPAAPARLFVDTGGEERHRLVARSMSLDRGRGVVEAAGEVEGVVYVFEDAGRGSGPGGALALPDARPGVPTTLGLATNGRIEIHTRLDRTDWAPRANAEQVIRVEGDLIAELTASNLEVDSLRAEWLEVALMHILPPARGLATTPTARMASPLSPAGSAGRTPPPVPGSTPVRAPTRWDIATERMTASFGETGFTSLDAEERVIFRSEDAVIRGASFTYDATRRRAWVKGDAKEAAQAIFGPESARNEVYAGLFVLSLDADGPTHLKAKGPARATLIRLDEKKDGALERFDLVCRGDVDITPTQLVTEYRTGSSGPTGIEIRRWARSGPGEPWKAPFLLYADRLVVSGNNLLSDAAADVERVVASGDRTTLRMGQGAGLTTVWGTSSISRSRRGSPHSRAARAATSA